MKNVSDHTKFQTTVCTFEDAAAFGNYHAGYMGVYSNVPRQFQYTFAGLGEIAKNPADKVERLKQIATLTAPYGDQKADYKANTDGMNQATRDKPWWLY